MRKPIVLSILAVLFVALPGTAAPPREADKAADAALATFRRLVNKSNFKAMGFESEDEVQKARLGAGIQEFLVGLDALQRFDANDNPGKLVRESARATYPVLVGDEVRSSLDVAMLRNAWRPATFGSPRAIRLIETIRTRLATEQKKPAGEFVVVRVPALNILFVGAFEGDDLFLTPVMDDRRFRFGAGKTMPAREVFRALQPAAKEHRGLPT